MPYIQLNVNLVHNSEVRLELSLVHWHFRRLKAISDNQATVFVNELCDLLQHLGRVRNLVPSLHT